MKGAWAVMAVTLLGGCAGLPGPTVERHAVPPVWQARCDRLAAADWTATGRIAVREGEAHWTASVRWRQTPDAFDLRLWGPLGAGAVRVSGDAQGAVLRTAEGETLRAADPDALFEQALHTRFPVSQLRAWLLGCPGDVRGRALGWDEGRLTALRQGDWRVEIPEYQWTGSAWLPARVNVTHETAPVAARLLIRRWRSVAPDAAGAGEDA